MRIAPYMALMPKINNSLNFKGASFCYRNPAVSYAAASFADTFKKSSQADNEISFEIPLRLKEYTPAIDRINSKIDKDKFLHLNETISDDIYSDIPLSTKTFAAENIVLASVFKETLDEAFGKGKYKFVSIGTSPACIAKVLKLTGSDVVSLPMSFSKTSSAKKWLDNSPYLENYQRYMNECSLSNESLEAEGKVAVVCDFANSGRSLELAQYMLTGPLWLNKDNIRIVTMNDIIQNSDRISNEWKEKYMKEYLYQEQMEQYCDVPHFDFLDTRPGSLKMAENYKDLKSYFEDYKAPHSNSFDFCVLKMLDDSGLIK